MSRTETYETRGFASHTLGEIVTKRGILYSVDSRRALRINILYLEYSVLMTAGTSSWCGVLRKQCHMVMRSNNGYFAGADSMVKNARARASEQASDREGCAMIDVIRKIDVRFA